MKKYRRLLACLTAAAMMIPMSACGSDNSSSKTEQSESSSQVSGEVLKNIFDELKKSDNYTQLKSYYPNTTFEEKLENDSIIITAKGTDGIDGTFAFPEKDGCLMADIKPDDFTSSVLFTTLMNCTAKYYGINGMLFSSYINGMGILGIESECYSLEKKADGSATMKLRIDEKPDMKELDEIYINEKVLSDLGDSSSMVTNIGKINASISFNNEFGTLSCAIGEYDGNTELTYKSIVEIVKKCQPTGYEEFLEKFTELSEISSDKYKVTKDSKEYLEQHELQQLDGYKYVFVTFGA